MVVDIYKHAAAYKESRIAAVYSAKWHTDQFGR